MFVIIKKHAALFRKHVSEEEKSELLVQHNDIFKALKWKEKLMQVKKQTGHIEKGYLQ